MKKFLYSMIIAAACFGATTSFGQDAQHDPEARAKKMSEKMKTELSLSESQYSKVYDINLKYAEKMSALKKEEGDRAAKMNSFKELKKGKNDELKAVLSEEQMQKYKDMKHDMRSGKKGHRKSEAQSAGR